MTTTYAILDSYFRSHDDLTCYLDQNGYSAIYTVNPSKYNTEDGHKIELNSVLHRVSDETFYQSDLRSIIGESENPYAGFYVLKDVNDPVQRWDILAVEMSEIDPKNTFNIPMVLLYADSEYYYVKPAVDLGVIVGGMEKQKFSFAKLAVSIAYKTKVYKVEKSSVTQQFQRVDVHEII